MGGSEGESRVQRLPYAFSGIGEAEFSKKMQSLINMNAPHSDAKWLLDQDRRTSEIQIEHQTKLSEDETDLAREGLLRKCVRNSMRLHGALQTSTPSNAQRRRRAFGKSEVVA
jgi:hypothetical protein